MLSCSALDAATALQGALHPCAASLQNIKDAYLASLHGVSSSSTLHSPNGRCLWNMQHSDSKHTAFENGNRYSYHMQQGYSKLDLIDATNVS